MRRQVSNLLVTMLLAGAVVATAATKVRPLSDHEVTRHITDEIQTCPDYTVWDEVGFRVDNGLVDLHGSVTEPSKKAEIERLVERVPGVTGVTDEIEVLPDSRSTERIRMQVARAIFGDPALSHYVSEPFYPIHVIVENGRVKLDGVVETEFDKNMAGFLAATAGFGDVTNNLQIATFPKKG